jgi:hypothetical protein
LQWSQPERGKHFGVAVSDFNGDGQPDIVVVDSTTANVSILLNAGISPLPTANFAQLAIFWPMGDLAGPVLTGDFNGDGKLDLAVPTSNAPDPQGNRISYVAILLGKGHGLFEDPVRYPVPNSPTSVAAGDFNGDGRTDLAVAADGGLSILLGKGDGRFQEAQTAGGSASRVIAGDLNGDGKTDLLTIESGLGFFVRLAKGDGTFQEATSYSAGVGASVSGLALGDFNHDGKLDIAVSGDSGDDTSQAGVWIFLGNGDGTFQTAVPYDVGGSTDMVVTGDWNGDGQLDLAVSASGGYVNGHVKILMGNGDGTFQKGASYGPIGIGSMAAGDLNGDGKVDLAIVGHQGLAVLLSNGNGTFQPTVGTDLLNVFEVTTGDFDGDGKLDLVTVDDRCYCAASVSIWVNSCSFAGPGLSAVRDGDKIVISWPSSSYKLERATNLAAPTWETNNLDAVTVSSGAFLSAPALEVTVPANRSQSYYRLRKQ